MHSKTWFWACIVCVGVAGIGLAQSKEPPRSTERPNFVFILADDLGYGDLGCYGHPKFKTPNIDRMAAEGIRLTSFYVPMPYCAPSRASILTGRYPFHHGMTSNPAPDVPARQDYGLNTDEVLLSEVLKKVGYATCCIGKWHLGHIPQYYPTRRGFDEYYGILYSNDMRPVQLWENEQVVEYPVVQATLTQRYTQRALAFIERNKERPFFLYLAHAMPHKPLACSERFYKKSGAGLYGDVMAELDWSVGQVLMKLRQLGLDKKTLVIFTSDNGPWYGGSTGSLRGMKGTSWEGGIRVPMIAWWPGKIPPGQVCDKLACAIDFFPTIAKLAGAPLPEDRLIDGRDIMPMLTAGAPSPHSYLLAMRGNRVMVIRDARWKLHVGAPPKQRLPEDPSKWIDPRAPDGVTILAPYEQYKPDAYPGLLTGDPPEPMMLFDLVTDPGEQHNVADQHQDVLTLLKAQFDKVVPPTFRPQAPKRK